MIEIPEKYNAEKLKPYFRRHAREGGRIHFQGYANYFFAGMCLFVIFGFMHALYKDKYVDKTYDAKQKLFEMKEENKRKQAHKQSMEIIKEYRQRHENQSNNH